MYEKRVCIVKQLRKGFSADGGTLSGAVYAERIGRELTVTPRVPLPPLGDGTYLLILRVQDRTFVFSMGEGAIRAEDAPSVREGFAALICHAGQDVEPVAFGRCGRCTAGAEQLLSEAQKKRPAIPLPPNELPAIGPNVLPAPGVPLPDPAFPPEKEGYDDEALADGNYYETVPPVPPAAPDGARGALTYYHSVREKIEEAFRGERDETLARVFPHSEWVRKGDALLGVVCEEGVPRYLCVAIRERPAALSDKAVFVPLSPFTEEEGYWIVFQDADTGEYVTTSVE